MMRDGVIIMHFPSSATTKLPLEFHTLEKPIFPNIFYFKLQEFSCDRTLTSSRAWCDEAGGVAWSPIDQSEASIGSIDQSEASMGSIDQSDVCGLHITRVSPGHRGHWSAVLIGQVRI